MVHRVPGGKVTPSTVRGCVRLREMKGTGQCSLIPSLITWPRSPLVTCNYDNNCHDTTGDDDDDDDDSVMKGTGRCSLIPSLIT